MGTRGKGFFLLSFSRGVSYTPSLDHNSLSRSGGVVRIKDTIEIDTVADSTRTVVVLNTHMQERAERGGKGRERIDFLLCRC